jgi:hypothetical protein
MIEAEKLQEIKTALPKGSLVKIKNKAGVSYLTVLKFFKGESQNVSVMEAVIEEYKAHTGRVSALNECVLKQA